MSSGMGEESTKASSWTSEEESEIFRPAREADGIGGKEVGHSKSTPRPEQLVGDPCEETTRPPTLDSIPTIGELTTHNPPSPDKTPGDKTSSSTTKIYSSTCDSTKEFQKQRDMRTELTQEILS